MQPLVGRTLKGQTKSITVSEDAVTIIPRALYHGFVGEKRIPYTIITAVQFKEAGGWLAGFIQFSIRGGTEWRGQVNIEACNSEGSRSSDRRRVRYAKGATSTLTVSLPPKAVIPAEAGIHILCRGNGRTVVLMDPGLRRGDERVCNGVITQPWFIR